MNTLLAIIFGAAAFVRVGSWPFNWEPDIPLATFYMAAAIYFRIAALQQGESE